MHVDDAAGKGTSGIARHVIGCHITQETRFQNALRRRRIVLPGPTPRGTEAGSSGGAGARGWGKVKDAGTKAARQVIRDRRGIQTEEDGVIRRLTGHAGEGSCQLTSVFCYSACAPLRVSY